MHRITNIYRVKSHAQYALADRYCRLLIEKYLTQFTDPWENIRKRNEVVWHHNEVKQKTLQYLEE